MSYLEFIKIFPSFHFLKPIFDKNLVPFKQWGKGEILFHSGNYLEKIYFFTSGRGRAYLPLHNGKEVIYAPYGAGDIAGDIEYIIDIKASGSMISIDNLSGFTLCTSVIPIELKSIFFKIISHGVTTKLIASSVGNAIRIGYPLDERVAYYCLYEFADKIYSMEELAGFFGTTYRHLSRVLKNLSDLGYIKVEKRVITILNREALESICTNIKEDSQLYIDVNK